MTETPRRLLVAFLGLTLTTGAAFAAMPELLAHYDLDKQRECEKIGFGFYRATACLGAKAGGMFVNPGGYIRVPVCPTIRAQPLMPELNLDTREGAIGFWYAPASGEATGRQVLFRYECAAAPRAALALYRLDGQLRFEATDGRGGSLRAAGPCAWKPNALRYVSASWRAPGGGRAASLRLFVDGKPLAEARGKLGDFGLAPTDFYIGSAAGAEAAVGRYDDIKVWRVTRERFDVTRDDPRDAMAAAMPIYVENFEGKEVPDAVVRKTILGRSLLLGGAPFTLTKGFLIHPLQGMVEVLYMPSEGKAGRQTLLTVAGKSDALITLARHGDRLAVNCWGVSLSARASLPAGRWAPLTVAWDGVAGKAWLFVGDRVVAEAKMPPARRTTVGDRIILGDGKAAGLMDGLRVWVMAAPGRVLGREGVLLTRNARYGVNTKSLNIYGMELRRLNVHAFTGGDYRIVPPPAGKKDVRPGSGPFTFAEGRLTDGVDENPGERYRISTGRRTDVIVDLKKPYVVTRVDLCAMNRWNWVTETVTFAVSPDGKTWQKVGASRDTTPKYGRQMRFIHRSPKFSIRARYVKATGAPRPGHYASFAEIKVYGKVW